MQMIMDMDAHELIGANFDVNNAFFHGIFSITIKQIQYNRKACVSSFVLIDLLYVKI